MKKNEYSERSRRIRYTQEKKNQDQWQIFTQPTEN